MPTTYDAVTSRHTAVRLPNDIRRATSICTRNPDAQDSLHPSPLPQHHGQRQRHTSSRRTHQALRAAPVEADVDAIIAPNPGANIATILSGRSIPSSSIQSFGAARVPGAAGVIGAAGIIGCAMLPPVTDPAGIGDIAGIELGALVGVATSVGADEGSLAGSDGAAGVATSLGDCAGSPPHASPVHTKKTSQPLGLLLGMPETLEAALQGSPLQNPSDS